MSAEPTFAGIFIQHEPELRLVAQFAGEKGADRGRELVSKLVRGVWADLVEVRSVAFSSAELHAARVKAEAARMEMNIPFESSTDVMDNSVEIRVTRPVEDDLLVEAGIELAPYVKIVVVDQLTVPFANLRASHALRTSAGKFQCTSGFNVRNSAGTRGVLTAGHCPNTEFTRGDSTALKNLPFRSQRLGGHFDVQWHTAPTFTISNLVNVIPPGSTSFIRVTGTRSRASQIINEFVCKDGASTGFTCGSLVRKDVLPNASVPNGTRTFMRVERCNTCTQTMARGGDSGSPVHISSGGGNVRAYGVLHGGSTNGVNFTYMAIDNISTLGVSVLTSP